jgi:excinuclease ABC subunit C
MRDGENRIIYVGKARILKNRLSSYFSGEKDVKTATLLRHVRSIETIIVANEYEALLLENTLIKQHSPRYNINLKDGKTYPVVRITNEAFPRIFRTRHIIEDGSRYFGPFPQIPAVDTMLALVEKLFPLRKCRSPWQQLKKRTGPCLYYHMGRCAAPCTGKITEAGYRRHVEQVEKLLRGETESLLAGLEAQMREAAEKLNFERAAQIRNAITAIGELSTDSTVIDFDPESRDYIAWAEESVLATFTVFSMRGGKMTGRELFRTRSAADMAETLETFITTYYTPGRPPPARIFLAENLLPGHRNGLRNGRRDGEGTESAANSPALPAGPNSGIAARLGRWFTEQFGFQPAFPAPAERRHQTALALARQNAGEDLRRRLKERGAGPALDELKTALGLKNRPERIEGFDIAQLGGRYPVASLVSFRDGVPDRKNYRHMRLRTVIGIVDDFASMREAVERRYTRLLKEGKEPPDLILIDGGIGQVNAAKGVLDRLGVDSDIAGLAKRDEELWLPGAREPVRLSKRAEALKVLQFVRDETHRFATSLNQKLRSKDILFSALESVEGIGPKRAAAIMKAYGSLEAIAAAESAALAEKCGVSARAAKAVRAAARLALEDRRAAGKRFADKKAGYGTGNAAAESLADTAALADTATLADTAAENAPDYDGEA